MARIITIISILLLSCNDTNNSSTNESINSDLNKKIEIIKLYKLKEEKTQDSIKRYDLDSLNRSILNSLYVVYGDEQLFDVNTEKNSLIAFLDLRLIKFDNHNEAGKHLLTYEIFWQDSVPVNSERKSKLTGIIFTTVLIDSSSKRDLFLIHHGQLFTPYDDFENIANKKIESNQFINFIEENRNKLHPKFPDYILR